MNTETRENQVIDDKFVLLHAVEAGAFGTVYRARQMKLDRIVAIKLLNAEMLAESDSLPRFEREARALATLKHKNIVAVYGHGVWREAPYMVLEFVEGKTLSTVIALEAPLEPYRACEIFIQVCEGLSCAHNYGIVHRDLKPTNIMLIPGATGGEQVKLIDFGLAMLVPGYGAAAQRLTEAGVAVGTCYYMSPEQCVGSEVDLRADIYSAGCILYEVLTGKRPFDAKEPADLMSLHMDAQPPSLIDSLGDKPIVEELQAVLNKSMAKDREQRYQSANEMCEDLKSIITLGQARNAVASPPRAVSERKTRIRPSVALLGAGLAVTLLMVASLFMDSLQSREPVATNEPTSADLYSTLRRVYGNGVPFGSDKYHALLNKIVERNRFDHLVDEPRMREVYRRLAQSYVDRQDYDNGWRTQNIIDQLNAKLKVRDDFHYQDQIRRSRLYAYKRDYVRSDQILAEALSEAKASDNALVACHIRMIQILNARERNDYAAAEKLCREALSEKQRLPDGWVQRFVGLSAEVALVKGNVAKASELAESALAINDSEDLYLENTAMAVRCALVSKHYDRAAKLVKDADLNMLAPAGGMQYRAGLVFLATAVHMRDQVLVNQIVDTFRRNEIVGDADEAIRFDEQLCAKELAAANMLDVAVTVSRRIPWTSDHNLEIATRSRI